MTTTTNAQFDREAWLTEAAQLILDEVITPAANVTDPTGENRTDNPFRVSVGYPPRSRADSRVLAVCIRAEASADQHNEIFVTPRLDDSLMILGSLAHELIHQSDDCKSGHRNYFARTARKIGLEGPLTATVPGPELSEYLFTIIDLLGPIPHAAINLEKAKKKQQTRMLKMECSDTACGFAYRTSQIQIDKIQDSVCPACMQAQMIQK